MEPSKIESAWKKLLGLDEKRMSIINGKLRIDFFNENDYGSYECIFALAINKQLEYFNQVVNISSDDFFKDQIDTFLFTYGDWNESAVEFNYEFSLGGRVNLTSVLSKEFNNATIIWRKNLANDTFNINSFLETYFKVSLKINQSKT